MLVAFVADGKDHVALYMFAERRSRRELDRNER